MKNIFGIFGVALLTMLLSGCSSGSKEDANSLSVEEQKQEQTQEQTQQESGPTQWIADLAGGKKMQCSYAMKGENDQTSEIRMYVEKDRYKTEMRISSGVIISLFDGGTIYSWTEGAKQGTKMEVQCMKDLGEQVGDSKETTVPDTYDSPEQAIGNIPDISCSGLESDVDFSVPSNIEFLDQCATLKKTMEQMKGLQTMPANIPDMPVDIPENVRGMMGR